MKSLKKLTILLFISIFTNILNVNAAGSVSVSASSNYVEEGSRVTFYINLKNVASWQLTGTGYGATSSCSLGDQGTGDSGTGENITKTLSVTCTANAVGQISFNVSGNVSSANGTKIETTNINTSKIVVVTEPREKDTNNYLKSLGVTGYTITPEFSKDTLEYSVNVPASINKVTLEATKESAYATLEGTGEKEVDEGANTFEIKVTSETGSERTYKITVNVKDENPINITINNQNYTIMKNLKNIDVPSTFEKTNITIDNLEIPAFYSETLNLTVVGIKNEDGKVSLAIYENETYTLYNETKASELLLYIKQIKEEKEGFIKGTVTINEEQYDCLKLSETSDFILVYAMDIITGKENFYMYDKENNTFTLYQEELMNKYIEEINKYKQVLLYGGIASGTFIFILLIIAMKKPKKKKKHEEKPVKVEKIPKEEPLKEKPENNEKTKKTTAKKKTTNTEVLEKVTEATKVIEDYEKTVSLNQEELKKVKEKKQEEDLEPTMYDLFNDDKPKKKRKKK